MAIFGAAHDACHFFGTTSARGLSLASNTAPRVRQGTPGPLQQQENRRQGDRGHHNQRTESARRSEVLRDSASKRRPTQGQSLRDTCPQDLSRKILDSRVFYDDRWCYLDVVYRREQAQRSCRRWHGATAARTSGSRQGSVQQRQTEERSQVTHGT